MDVMASDLRGGETAGGDSAITPRIDLDAAVERILSVEPEEHALRRLVGAVAEGVPQADCALLVLRDAEGRLELATGVGMDGGPPPPPGGLEVPGLERLAVVDRPGPPLPAGTRVAAGAPVRAGDAAGALVIGSRTAERMDARALLLLRLAADRAALVLDRARLRRGRDDALGTLRRAEADLDARRKAVDFILGVVGHDLRNPLGAVHMSASLLHTKGALTGWQARAVERLRSSAGRMGRIIADLLSYTRTRLGNGLPMNRRPANLEQVVRKVVDELAAVNPSRAVAIDVRGDPGGEWDPDRLEQATSNVVSNAFDHGDPDTPVRVEVDGEGTDAVVLRVHNGGPGIPPEVLAHLFEPFSRAPDEKSRKASGLGLGLYIAREIVRAHGGDIGATSGEHTTVTVRLPRRTA
jgi:signal transduction histidine kinase